LTWIDKLLDNVRALFTGLYGEQVRKKNSSLVDTGKFDPYFDRQIQELEKTSEGSAPKVQLTPPSTDNDSGEEGAPSLPVPQKAQRPLYDTSTDSTPVPTPDTSRPTTPAQSHLLAGKTRPGAKLSRRDRRKVSATNTTAASSGDEASVQRRGKAAGKKNRIWGDFGAEEEDTSVVLDYSRPAADGDNSGTEALEEIKQETWGRKTGKGQFVLKDIDEEMDAIIAEQNAKKESSTAAPSGIVGSSLGVIGSLFRNVVGGKTLTKEDLANSLKGMEEHLLKKNVAREAAVRLCDSVERDLIGLKTGNFTSKKTLCFHPSHNHTNTPTQQSNPQSAPQWKKP
jgi:signal recognition particle receptor subunit alpha